MAKASNYTKKVRAELWTLRAVDLVLLLTPIITYFIMGLCADGVVHEKIALVGSMAVALILTVLNIVAKKHLRSPIWIVLIGIYVAVDNIMPLVILLAVTAILDEFIFTPLINNRKTALVSNKEIDKRI